MTAVYICPIEHSPNANDPIIGKLIITANLSDASNIQFIWSICGGDFSCDEELSFCGMLHNGSKRSATITIPPLRPTGFAFGRQE